MIEKVKKYRVDVLIIFLVLLFPFIHEIGHYIGYRIDGVHAFISYNMTYSSEVSILGTLGGPMMNVTLGLISLIIIIVVRKYKRFWAMVGITSLLSRLMVAGSIFTVGMIHRRILLIENDEGQLASLLGTHVVWTYIIAIGIYIIFILFIRKALKDNKFFNKIFIKILIDNFILVGAVLSMQFIGI